MRTSAVTSAVPATTVKRASKRQDASAPAAVRPLNPTRATSGPSWISRTPSAATLAGWAFPDASATTNSAPCSPRVGLSTLTGSKANRHRADARVEHDCVLADDN